MSKVIYLYLEKVIGGKIEIIRYAGGNHSTMDVISAKDKPFDGVTTYATVGLSNYSIGLKLDNKRALRTEFIGACATEYDWFGNMVSSCAFHIIDDHFACKPGIIYPNMIYMYNYNLTMKHVMFETPFMWDKLESLDDGENTVVWLMLVPISDSELQYAQEYGIEALEALLEEKEADICDINREPVV